MRRAGLVRQVDLPRYLWERSGSRTLRIRRKFRPTPEALARISAWTQSLREPILSVCIPTTDRLDLLIPCLESLAATCHGQPMEVIVGSTASSQQTLEVLARTGVRTISLPPPFNFSRACNEMEKAAAGSGLLFLNSDTRALSRDWVGRLLNASDDEIVGATLVYPGTSRVQHAGIEVVSTGTVPRLLKYGYRPQLDLALNNVCLGKRLESCTPPRAPVMAVTGAFMYSAREHFRSLGRFDEAYRSDLQDYDYCLRARAAGMRVVCRRDIVFSHKHAASRGRYRVPKADWQLFLGRWATELGGCRRDARTLSLERQ